MICFEFSVNGKRISTAGIPSHAVLSAHVTWASDGRKRRDLVASLGGLDSNEEPGYHLYWAERRLKVGDTVEVHVVEAPRCDAPRSRRRARSSVELQNMASKSYRSAITRHKKQRASLDREIIRLEGLLATSRRKSRRRSHAKP